MAIAIALVAICSSNAAPVVGAPSTDPAAAHEGVITDPVLLAEMARAGAPTGSDTGTPPQRATPSGTLAVEVLTTADALIAAEVRALGGTVTGNVPGAVVQALVPVASITRVAGLGAVTDVRAPRHANMLPPVVRSRAQSLPGFGPSKGDEVALTNTAAWQTAGFTGAGVKVGVIDYFNFTYWNTAEMGTQPTKANGHAFCLDSAPIAGDPRPLCTADGQIANGIEHGPAVVEIVKDMAPDADVYVASVDTAADLKAALDWFHSKGVTIVSRSLGSAYDGPGDGTGALDAVADYAVNTLGITWFNSAGNGAVDSYMRRTVPTTLKAPMKKGSTTTYSYVNFNDGRPSVGPGTDTWLRLDIAGCGVLGGVRWSTDWNLPAASRTDYRLELWAPKSAPPSDHWNPTGIGDVTPVVVQSGPGTGSNIIDAKQTLGAAPLEGSESEFCADNKFGFTTASGLTLDVVYLRVRLNNSVGSRPDSLEIGMGDGLLELDYFDTAGSASVPVVDSRNPGVVSVGAIDLTEGPGIADYSSQGPTYDGRIKPDVSAPSGFYSSVYSESPWNSAFSGTSSSAPTVAGMAAVLQGAGLAISGAGTGDLVRHFVTDLGPPGADNAFGTGEVHLPDPPTAAPSATPGKFVPADQPTRIIDTRPGGGHVGPFTGPFVPGTILDVPVLGNGGVPASGVSAVVLNVTSVGAPGAGFVQAYPYLRTANGATSTLNVSTPGVAQPNFAIVPVGADGKVSLWLQSGGQVLVDVMGYFADGQTVTHEGRYIPLAVPERWLDTRGGSVADPTPLPASFLGTPRKVAANETIEVPIPAPADTQVPSGAEALVVNVTATRPDGNGYLKATTPGVSPDLVTASTANYRAGSSANLAIVPLGGPGTIDITAYGHSTDVIVDVVGYITGTGMPTDTRGLFVPLTPARAFDTRDTHTPFTAVETRAVDLNGVSTVLPPGAESVSLNVTVVHTAFAGWLSIFGGAVPATSSLNFAAGQVVANAALSASPGNTVQVLMGRGSADVILDVNGYFLAGSA